MTTSLDRCGLITLQTLKFKAAEWVEDKCCICVNFPVCLQKLYPTLSSYLSDCYRWLTKGLWVRVMCGMRPDLV